MKKLLICCALLLMAFLPASTVNNYRYILIQSHQVKPATMQFFDQNGKLLSTKNVVLQGIGTNSGEPGLTTPLRYGDKVFIGSFGETVKKQLLSINLATLTTELITVKPRELGNYTAFTIFNNEIYSALNAPTGNNRFATFLGKHSLSSTENRVSTSLEHAYIDMFIPYRNTLLSVGFDWRKNGIIVRTHNKDTLEVTKEQTLTLVKGVSDVKLIGDELLISAWQEGSSDDNNNQLLIYNLQTKKTRTIQLPFSVPQTAIANKTSIFTIQDQRAGYSFTPLVKLNRKTGDVEKTLSFRSSIKHIQLANNELIVVTENRVFFYNPTTMKVKRSFPYKMKDDMMFGSFIVR